MDNTNLRWRTIDQMIEEFGFSRKTWYSRVYKKKIRYCKDGKIVLIDRDAYLKQRESTISEPK